MGSRRASQFCPLSTSLFAALSLLLSPNLADAQQATPSASDQPQAEVAPRGQRSTVRQIKYGDWQKYCFKTPGTNQVCRTTISGNFDTGQTAVRADLIEREEKARYGCNSSFRSDCTCRPASSSRWIRASRTKSPMSGASPTPASPPTSPTLR